jgi:hypothetical protein
MKTVQFPEQNRVFAKDQPEYIPLPAFCFEGPQGRVACCWSLSWRERFSVLVFGKIWQQVLTFGEPLQPQKLTVEKPSMPA